MALVASVSSAKGGSGKSTTSLNLGVSLANLGRDVTIIDANLSTPYLSMYLGAPNVPVTLHHVLRGNANILEAVYKHASGTKIVPGSISMRDFEDINIDDLQLHLPQIKSDIIILDAAPGLDREAQGPIKMADEVLIVTTPELPSVAQALKTIRLAQKFDKPVTGVVLTRAGHDLDLKIKNIETILEHPIIGIIPEDHQIKKALIKREPITHILPNAPSSVAYQKLAAYLTGHNFEPVLHSSPNKFFKFVKWSFGVR